MAYNFVRASSQYIVATSAPVTAEPITMACWANLSDITNNHELLVLGDSTSTRERFSLAARGDIAGDPVQALSVDTTGSQGANATAGYTANTWFHAAVVFAATNDRRAYLNGGSKATNATNRGTIAGLDRTAIGAAVINTATSFASGDIAEAAIWSAALDDAEIAALAAGFPPYLVRPASLVFYAPLIRDPVDLRGGLVLTPTNGPTVSAHTRIMGGRKRSFIGRTAAAGTITGTLGVTLDGATVSATGALPIAGQVGVTLGGATLAATGVNPDATPASVGGLASRKKPKRRKFTFPNGITVWATDEALARALAGIGAEPAPEPEEAPSPKPREIPAEEPEAAPAHAQAAVAPFAEPVTGVTSEIHVAELRELELRRRRDAALAAIERERKAAREAAARDMVETARRAREARLAQEAAEARAREAALAEEEEQIILHLLMEDA